MSSKRRLALGLVVVALALAGVVMAGTALEIRQPVSATVTISNLGSSPSFDIIDNVFDATTNAKSGAAAGYIDSQDNYVIGFGSGNPGGDWVLSFGRSQTAKVGDGSDFVFKVKNHYANNMTVKLVETTSSLDWRGRLGAGIVIKVVNAAGDADQWVITGSSDPRAWTITGSDLVLATGEEAVFYLKVENSNAVAGNWSPFVRFQATAD